MSGEFSPFRLLGAVAVAAGIARLGSTFADWSVPTAELEAFAFLLDVALLLGLSGFYFANAAQLGIVGFIGYAVTAAGIAFITGPDGQAFGVDIYQMGVAIISVGLSILSALLLLRRIAFGTSAAWIASIIIGAGGGAIGRGDEGFRLAGALFALGFIAAGLTLLKKAPADAA